MIVVKNLRVDVLTETLFQHVHTVIRPGERIGMVPGTGNTMAVFLQTIAGITEEDEGSITHEGERVSYVSPETIRGGMDSLARVLHNRPTFLCVNASGVADALDIASLSRFIAGYRGGMLLLTDQPELMKLAKITRFFYIQPTTKELMSYTGVFEDYLIEHGKVEARATEAYEKQQREKARLEGWLDKKREEVSGRPSEHGAVIRAKAKYLQKEILDKEIPKPPEVE